MNYYITDFGSGEAGEAGEKLLYFDLDGVDSELNTDHVCYAFPIKDGISSDELAQMLVSLASQIVVMGKNVLKEQIRKEIE